MPICHVCQFEYRTNDKMTCPSCRQKLERVAWCAEKVKNTLVRLDKTHYDGVADLQAALADLVE